MMHVFLGQWNLALAVAGRAQARLAGVALEHVIRISNLQIETCQTCLAMGIHRIEGMRLPAVVDDTEGRSDAAESGNVIDFAEAVRRAEQRLA